MCCVFAADSVIFIYSIIVQQPSAMAKCKQMKMAKMPLRWFACVFFLLVRTTWKRRKRYFCLSAVNLIVSFIGKKNTTHKQMKATLKPNDNKHALQYGCYPFARPCVSFFFLRKKTLFVSCFCCCEPISSAMKEKENAHKHTHKKNVSSDVN